MQCFVIKWIRIQVNELHGCARIGRGSGRINVFNCSVYSDRSTTATLPPGGSAPYCVKDPIEAINGQLEPYWRHPICFFLYHTTFNPLWRSEGDHYHHKPIDLPAGRLTKSRALQVGSQPESIHSFFSLPRSRLDLIWRTPYPRVTVVVVFEIANKLPNALSVVHLSSVVTALRSSRPQHYGSPFLSWWLALGSDHQDGCIIERPGGNRGD